MPVSDEEIMKRLQELLETVDMETTSERKLREMLEAEFGENLKERKAIIRQEIDNYLDRQQRENEEEAEEEGVEDDGVADEDNVPAAEQKSKAKKGRRNNNHFGSILSPELQEFLGVESMPRTQVVKTIWVYIKEHNLQDPKNKRKICPDEKLGKILPARTDMLKMNQQLSKHVYTQDHFDVDEEEEEEEEEAPAPQPKRKAAPKAAAARKPAAKKAAASTKAKREAADNGHQEEEDAEEDEEDEQDEESEDEKPKKKRRKAAASAGGGSMLSPELQAFVGAERMGRFQVVKVIWAYIKEKDLQNPKDRRQILPDAKLGKILKAPVTAFTLNKQLSKHIIKSS